MTDRIKIDVNVNGQQAVDALKRIEDQTKKITKATAESAEATRSARQRLNDLADGYTNTRNLVRDAVSVATSFADAIADYEKEQRAITTLGAAFDEVTTATRGAVTAQQALLAQQTLAQSGMTLQAGQLGVLTRKAREYALVTGTEVTQALNQLVDGLRTGSGEALSRFGITVDATRGKLENMDRALATMAETQRNAAPSARTLSEEMSVLGHELNVLSGVLAQGLLTKMRELYQWWARINGVEGSFVRQAGEVINWIGNQQGRTDREQGQAWNERQDQRLRTREGLRAYARTHGIQLDLDGRSDRDLDDLQALAQRRGSNALALVEMNARQIDRAGAERDLRNINAERDAMVAAITSAAARRARRASYRGPAGSGGSSDPTKLDGKPIQSVDDIFSFYRPRETSLAEETQAFGSFQSQDFSDTADAIGAMRDPSRDARDQASRRAERNRRNSEMARLSTVGGRLQEGLGVTADFMATQARMTDGYADMAVGAFSKIGSAITEHIALVIQGKETLGEALLAGTNQVASALAAEAAPRAIMELAAGFAALANPITAATAPLHFTAFGLYSGIAAGAGLVSLGTGAAMAGAKAPAGASGADTRRSSSLAPRSSSASSQNSGPVTIVLSSLVPPGPRELQTLSQAMKQGDRYGLNKQSPRPVRV